VTGRNLTVMDSATGGASLGYVWNCHNFQIDHRVQTLNYFYSVNVVINYVIELIHQVNTTDPKIRSISAKKSRSTAL
jgi:hypothetical protein